MSTAAVNPFKRGDILYYNAGYNMGIPTFIEVTRTTPTLVFGRRLETRSVSDDGYGQNGSCVPIPGSYKNWDGEEKRVGFVRHTSYGTVVQTKGRYHHWADIWDGRPKDYYTD